MRFLAILLMVTTLGCSGNGGATTSIDDGGTPIAPEPPKNPGTDITDPSSLPLTGRARYDGTVNLTLGAASVSSPMGVDVDFGATDAQVTAQASNFAGMDGTVFFTLGEIDRAPAENAPTIAGTVSGTLKDGSVNQIVFGTFQADFAGTGQAAIRGTVAGSLIANAVQSGMSGTFQAARAP